MKSTFLTLCGFLSVIFAFSSDAKAQSTVSVAGPESLAEILIPSTLEGFSRNVGLTIRREVLGDGAFALALIDPNAQVTVARFDFQVTDTPTALASLAAGNLDFALATRDPEVQLNTPLIAIGRDAVVPIVSKSNPLDQLSVESLVRVLSGEITDWAELGRFGGPIQIHLLEEGTEQDVYLKNKILGDRLRGGTIKLHLSESGIADAIAKDPNALGIGVFSEIGNAKALNLSGPCGVSVSAGRTEIKNGDYPFVTPINLYYRDRGYSQVVTGFLRFLSSYNAQGPIRQAGYVDSADEIQALTDQGDRLVNAIRIVGKTSPASELRRLVNELDGFGRASYSFRFLPKSSDLDEASLAEVHKLGQAIRNGLYDGKNIRFVGFSDGVGSAEQNLRISQSRARLVESAVRDAAGGNGDNQVTFSTDSFGEALPIACDETDWGRHANRRVEVWVK